MPLSDDEKAQLAALQAKENEPDEDYQIEIWDETGAGAKLPFSQGRTWLQRFGIGVPEPTEDEPKTPKGKAAPKADGDNVTHAAKYFANKGKSA
jgi:hypothetical protein